MFFDSEAEVLAEQHVGGDGSFRLEVPEAWIRRSDYRTLDLWVLREDTRLALLPYTVEDVPAGERISVRLAPSSIAEVTVRDEEGRPAPDVAVRPSNYGHSLVPETLAEDLTFRTDDAGVARIDTWELERVQQLTLETERHGRQAFFGMERWLAEGEVKLLAPGELALEHVGEAPALPPGQVLTLQSSAGSGGLADGLSGRGVVRVGLAPEASPTLRPLAGGSLEPFLLLPHPLERLPVISGGHVRAGETFTAKIEWKAGVHVTSRVVDAKTGEGIEGAAVWISSYPLYFPVVSGADGALSFRALPGGIAVCGVDPPPPYSSVRDEQITNRIHVPSEAEEATLADVVLDASPGVRGRVVDEAGDPVAGAWAFGYRQRTEGRAISMLPIAALADAQGEFAIAGALTDVESFQLEARLGTARTDGRQEVMPGAEPAVELVVRSKTLVPIAGIVRDQHGRPVAEAKVSVWESWDPNPVYAHEKVMIEGADHLLSDENGRFSASPRLVAGKRYALVVESPATELVITPWLASEEIAEGIELVAPRLAALRGRLVDAEGRPVAGARVFVPADAPAPVETTSDADGCFVLDRVFLRGGFVFMESEGEILRGRRFTIGEPIEWSLGDRAELLPVDAPPGSRDEELAVARRLVEVRLETARGAGEPYQVFQALGNLALLDPDAALAGLEDGILEDEDWCESIRHQVAKVIARSDLDEALAIVGTIPIGYTSVRARLDIVRALPEEQHARRLEILGTAFAEARRVDDPAHRVLVLGRIAELLLDLGEREAGLEVLEEGRPLAEELPAEEWSGYARSSFAEELAQVDLEAALEIVEDLTDDFDRKRHLGNIAFELADKDPAAAEEVLDRLPKPATYYRPHPAICHAMVSVDPERALRIAARTGQASTAHGLMAKALADTDPERARGLLESAFQGMETLADGPRRERFTNDCAMAPSLLPLAERIAPERLEEYLWRAIALRAPRYEPDSRPGPDTPALIADGGLAYYVARYDPDLARDLLEPLVAFLRSQVNRVDSSTRDWAPVYAALAEVDPAWAEELAREVLPANAAGIMAEVLAREGEDRVRHVEKRYLGLWTPDQEDLF